MGNTMRHLFLVLALSMPMSTSVHARFLKIATLAPEGTSWMAEMRRGAEEIAKQTAGRVQLKFYPGGVMGTDKTVLRKIRAGQLHGGAFTSVSLLGVYVDAQIYGLPFLFRSYDEVDYVRARMDSEIRDGLEAHGMVTLGITEGGFAYLLSDEPLRSRDDAKGKKVWVPEGDLVSQTALEVAGIAPVSLPIADVYTGLQTGLIDTVATTPAAAIALQWHTKVRYFTDVPLMYLVGFVVIDKTAFDGLSAGDQAVVRSAMGEVLESLGRRNRQDDEGARQALQNQGIQFVRPESEAELERWRSIAAEALFRLQDKGVYSPAMLERIQGHLRAYRNQTGSGDGG